VGKIKRHPCFLENEFPCLQGYNGLLLNKNSIDAINNRYSGGGHGDNAFILK
jgi:hypothetical protein